MVIEDDSFSRGCGFKSQHRILEAGSGQFKTQPNFSRKIDKIQALPGLSHPLGLGPFLWPVGGILGIGSSVLCVVELPRFLVSPINLPKRPNLPTFVSSVLFC